MMYYIINLKLNLTFLIMSVYKFSEDSESFKIDHWSGISIQFVLIKIFCCFSAITVIFQL